MTIAVSLLGRYWATVSVRYCPLQQGRRVMLVDGSVMRDIIGHGCQMHRHVVNSAVAALERRLFRVIGGTGPGSLAPVNIPRLKSWLPSFFQTSPWSLSRRRGRFRRARHQAPAARQLSFSTFPTPSPSLASSPKPRVEVRSDRVFHGRVPPSCGGRLIRLPPNALEGRPEIESSGNVG